MSNVLTTGPKLARSPIRAAWHALASLYQRAEATERGYVWLNKLGPAYVFALIALLKGWSLSGHLEQLFAGHGEVKLALLAAHQALGVAFFGLVATLYLLRRRPLRRVANPVQGLVALLGSFVMLPVAFGGPANHDPAVLLLADLLMVVGTAGAAIALMSLGRCFGIFPEARGLVTHGAYRLVRHPMYLFEFVAFLGILLPSCTPLNVLLYAAFVGFQLGRMDFEEQMLIATFPTEYPAYCRRTARLIPGVY